MPKTKTVQLPPANLPAQNRAWKDYLRKKYRSMRVLPDHVRKDVVRVVQPA